VQAEDVQASGGAATRLHNGSFRKQSKGSLCVSHISSLTKQPTLAAHTNSSFSADPALKRQGSSSSLAANTALATARSIGTPLHEEPGTLEGVLDYMHDNGLPFLKRYRVGNHFQLRAGGQGFVQFIELEHDGAPLAVKVRTFDDPGSAAAALRILARHTVQSCSPCAHSKATRDDCKDPASLASRWLEVVA
jgi:hypothetical protein